MPHTKTPGGQQASEKFQKQQAEKEGLGAENAPAHKEGFDKHPGHAAVASDSGISNVGVEAGTNRPGEDGIKGVPVSSEPSSGNANMK